MNTWWLWAAYDNPMTNKYFAQIIEGYNEEFLRVTECSDGGRRRLFRCPNGYRDVKTAIAAMPDYNLKFEVFRSEGDCKPYPHNLWKKAVKRKVREASYRRGIKHQRPLV